MPVDGAVGVLNKFDALGGVTHIGARVDSGTAGCPAMTVARLLKPTDVG